MLDAPERIAVFLERSRELVPDGPDLEHHHAHGVGDDVVQLARDPRALLGHRDPRGGLSLALGMDGAHLAASRSCSARVARISAASACSERSRSANRRSRRPEIGV